jgi:cytochrome c6
MRLHPLRSWRLRIRPGAHGMPLIAAAAFTAAVTVAGAARGFAQDPAQAEGGHVFMTSHCFVCHGEMGNGGAGPGFRDDRFLAITDYVVAQILIGRGIMPPFADKLSDGRIAAVATYIRTNWGNDFGEVKPEQVAQVRKQLEGEEARTGSSQPGHGQTPNPPPEDRK